MSQVVAKTIKGLRQKIVELPKVQLFLDSKGRNSNNTGSTYLTALVHFADFLSAKYPIYDVETIIKPLLTKEIDIYQLLDGFISHQDKKGDLAVKTRIIHLGIVKSYLTYHDVDIVPEKFRHRVTTPKLYREDEEALSVEDIRKLLLACGNRRLKAYLFFLLSGARATEALSVQNCGVDFTTSPVTIYIRKQYSKTRVARFSFLTDEAARCLTQWLEYKYRDRGKYRVTRKRKDEDLIFEVKAGTKGGVYALYRQVRDEFNKLLDVTGLNARKEGSRRRKITLHSFRRFTKSVVSDNAGKDYSEWLIGHAKSPYYTKKVPEKMEIYKRLCMKPLTILDYETLQTHSKNVDVRLAQKDAEIERQTKQITELEQRVLRLSTNRDSEVQGLREQIATISKALLKAGLIKPD